jgi:hypothetical protein
MTPYRTVFIGLLAAWLTAGSAWAESTAAPSTAPATPTSADTGSPPTGTPAQGTAQPAGTSYVSCPSGCTYTLCPPPTVRCCNITTHQPCSY